jgi:DNA-binding transcriptional LysR family regulator
VPGLVATPLLEERVLLALPATWRRVRDPVPLKRLADADWIVGSRGGDDLDLAKRACAMAGFLPRITHTVDDYDLVLQMVAAGLGIGFVPELGLKFPSAKAVTLRGAAGMPLHRRIYALTRSAMAAEPLAQAVLAELR